MDEVPGHALAFLLAGTFRALVDEVHADLAARGHPGLRPAQGFALQALGEGATAGELGERLAISKQAAAKAVDGLERRGYVTREVDPADARRKVVRVSRRGHEMLELSARAFDQVAARWRAQLGEATYAGMVRGLRVLGSDGGGADFGAWVGSDL